MTRWRKKKGDGCRQLAKLREVRCGEETGEPGDAASVSSSMGAGRAHPVTLAVFLCVCLGDRGLSVCVFVHFCLNGKTACTLRHGDKEGTLILSGLPGKSRCCFRDNRLLGRVRTRYYKKNKNNNGEGNILFLFCWSVGKCRHQASLEQVIVYLYFLFLIFFFFFFFHQHKLSFNLRLTFVFYNVLFYLLYS